MDDNLSKKIQELQLLEQSIQNLLMQKQQIQIDLAESTNAHKEVSNTSGDVYKVLGGIMLKSEKNIVLKELDDKKRVLQLKIDALENQEDVINSKISQLRKEISSSGKQ
ncbi:MAG: prefoldin subunit [Nanoarchaeota archaeon]